MEQLPQISMLILAVVSVTMAFVLMGFKSVSFQEDHDLSLSRQYITYAYLVLAASNILHLVYGFRVQQPSVGIALDITAYFLVAILLSYVYIPLIYPYYRKSRVKWLHISCWFLSSACLWTASLFTYGLLSTILITVGGVLCIASIVRILVDFIRRYHIESDTLTDTDLYSIESFRRFMYRSALLMGFVGFASVGVTLFGNLDWKSYFSIFSAFIFFLLGMSYINYVTNLKG